MNWLSLEHLGVEFLLGTFTVISYVLTLLLVPAVLLNKKRWPASTVAWLMAILTIPVLGGLLYLIFGTERLSRRVRMRRAAAAVINRAYLGLGSPQLLPHSGLTDSQLQLLRLAKNVAQSTATMGNRVQVLQHTPVAFAEIEAAIRGAESSIHLEYYIWQPDRIGTQLRDLLIEKSRAGLKIRFLYDSIGSLRLKQSFLTPMREAGIEVAAFVPSRGWWENWSINFRSHRKIIVVDGKVGFTGGMNVGDEYLGLSKHFGYWRDTHLRLEGPVVMQLQEVFVADWFLATGHEPNEESVYPRPAEPGKVAAHVVAGGPDCDPSVFHTLMFAAINEAQSQVTLATSYFVPTPALTAALVAAGYRGVKVRVLVSGPVTYWVTYHAARSFYEELLQAGVEIYEYRRGQQHAKTLTIDGAWSLVGTPNFDSRSVFLNFEVGVICYDHGIAEQLDHHFSEDLQHAVQIDAAEWRRRSLWEQLKENACRMFQPVL